MVSPLEAFPDRVICLASASGSIDPDQSDTSDSRLCYSMVASGLRDLVGFCEQMLARQDRLIAKFKNEGRDTSDAIRLRRQITDLIGSIQDGIRIFGTGRRN